MARNCSLQSLMTDAYAVFRQPDVTWSSRWDAVSVPHRVAVLLGNFNYQVENGGLIQYVDNNFARETATVAPPYLALATIIHAGAAHDPELAAAALAMLRHIHEEPKFRNLPSEEVPDPESETGEMMEEPGLDVEEQRMAWYQGHPEPWCGYSFTQRSRFMQAVLNAWPAGTDPFAAASAAAFEPVPLATPAPVRR